ncbi:hypothetical protein BpHYR1_032660 [Brachionus plicatilis]|uniref:Uncharacterized protein n=1 Tax=Brachionus plicatilis TaxID=10195 RepID=A0A3M7QZR4_BRAPC|nr:hypothetical protein BpHYR1_032660 [Brachionus plicatilis]
MISERIEMLFFTYTFKCIIKKNFHMFKRLVEIFITLNSNPLLLSQNVRNKMDKWVGFLGIETR